MKFDYKEYKGNIIVMLDNSRLFSSIKGVVNQLDLSGEMLKSVLNGNLTYTLEYSKSKELEILRYRLGETNYFIVRKGSYTLMCSDKEKSVCPAIYQFLNHKPVNLGFIIPESQSGLYVRNNWDETPIPGTGCEKPGEDCSNLIIMDSGVGYAATAAFYPSKGLYRLSGSGYGDVERSWEMVNKDVRYVERKSGNEVAKIDWKFVSSGVRDYKWKDFIDFMPKDAVIAMVETKPGSSVGVPLNELADLKNNAIKQDKIADRESGARPIPRPELPNSWGIGAGICLFAFIVIATIAILRRRSV